MTFERLIAADGVAMVAALALLFVMAADWYSTAGGDEARRIERFTEPRGALGGEIPREVDRRARAVAEGSEKNAWQLRGAIDRVTLGGLLLTVVLALAAAFLRAAGRRFAPPWTPSAIAALSASLTALLVAFRALQQPGFDEATTVKSGVPLALVALGVLALSCARALRCEGAGTAWRDPPGADPAIESNR